MLVLSRKPDESISIDEDIKITVVELRPDKVRLGVEAYKEIRVHRTEVQEAIHRNEPNLEVMKKMFGDYLKNKEFVQAFGMYSSGLYLPNSTEKIMLLKGLGGIVG